MHELLVLHRVVSPDECNRMVALIESNLLMADMVSHVGYSIPFPPEHVGEDILHNVLKYLAPFKLETLRLSKMSTGNYHSRHADKCPRTPNREVFVGMYFGTYYDGGEVHIPELGAVVDPQVGSLMRFDGRTLHEVRPVLNGTRYALTAWGVKDGVETRLST